MGKIADTSGDSTPFAPICPKPKSTPHMTNVAPKERAMTDPMFIILVWKGNLKKSISNKAKEKSGTTTLS